MDEQSTPSQTQKSSMGPVIAIVGIIVIVAAAYIGYTTMNKNTQQAANTTTQQTTQQTESAPTTATEETMQKEVSAYKNGTYTAVGNYTSPGGPEELGVSLVLEGGIVTDATVEVKATRPASKERQTDFAENYKTEVVGKNIDEISLGKVSGSSLTPKGFNDAIEQVKTEAKS